VPPDNLLLSLPVDTVDVYVVTVLSEKTTEVGHVMTVPGNFVFRENITHSALIVIGVVVVPQRRRDISVIIAGRSITIAIVTIPGLVAEVIRRIGIIVESVWVGPVSGPPRTPPPWGGEVADKDDFIEMLEAMKLISSIKAFIVETVKASKAQG
jgi:hypothetical protein